MLLHLLSRLDSQRERQTIVAVRIVCSLSEIFLNDFSGDHMETEINVRDVEGAYSIG